MLALQVQVPVCKYKGHTLRLLSSMQFWYIASSRYSAISKYQMSSSYFILQLIIFNGCSLIGGYLLKTEIDIEIQIFQWIMKIV